MENSHGNSEKPPRLRTTDGTAVAMIVESRATSDVANISEIRIGPRDERNPMPSARSAGLVDVLTGRFRLWVGGSLADANETEVGINSYRASARQTASRSSELRRPTGRRTPAPGRWPVCPSRDRPWCPPEGGQGPARPGSAAAGRRT